MSDDEMDMAMAMGDDMDMAAAMGDDDLDMAAAMGGDATPPEPSMQRLARSEDYSKIGRFDDIEVVVDAVLGRVSMPIEQFLKLGRGAIVELEQTKDDDVELAVNGIVVAKAEITVLEENVGVTVKNIAKKNKMYGVEGVYAGEQLAASPEGDASDESSEPNDPPADISEDA